MAGKLTASQFRSWSLTTMSEIIEKVRSFREKPAVYIQAYGFRNAPELGKFTAVQKDRIIQLIALLLDLKNDPGIGYRDTGISPLVTASEMGRYVFVQYLLECDGEGERCDMEGYYACEFCGKTTFYVVKRNGEWSLECREHRRRKWSTPLPVEGTCERGHRFTITQQNLKEKLEILPSDELLQTISGVVNQYIPEYEFHDQIEGFMVRGNLLYYFKDRSSVTDTRHQQVTIFNKIQVGVVESGGTVTGVRMGGAK